MKNRCVRMLLEECIPAFISDRINLVNGHDVLLPLQSMLVLLSIQAARGNRKANRLYKGGTPNKTSGEPEVWSFPIKTPTAAARGRRRGWMHSPYDARRGLPKRLLQLRRAVDCLASVRARLKIPVVLDLTRSCSWPSNTPSPSGQHSLALLL